MAELEDLYAQIPVDQIAERLGVEPGKVASTVKTLVPVLVGGLAHNVAADDIDSSQLESTVAKQGASDLLDGGVNVDHVDEAEGSRQIAGIFGGNNPAQVASALSGAGAGDNDLIKQLLPILVPIVLAYIGKRLTEGSAAAPAPAPAPSGGGGLGDILGGILGGSKGDNPLGTILGQVLGGNKGSGGGIGDIIGDLIRGRK